MPIIEDEAPNVIKTKEKPDTKAMEWISIMRLNFTVLNSSARSIDAPLMNTKYEGTSGKTQVQKRTIYLN